MRVFQGSYELGHRSFGGMLQPALPHNKHPPSGGGEAFTDFGIPPTIGLQLGKPEILAGRWRSGIMTILMTMPETAMYKNYSPVLGQNDIRLARELPCVKTVAKAGSMKRATHQHFRLGILASDPGHHPGARLLVDDIGHTLPAFYHQWRNMNEAREG